MNAVSPRNDKKPRSLRSGADKSVKNQPLSEVAVTSKRPAKPDELAGKADTTPLIVPTLAPAAFVQFSGRRLMDVLIEQLDFEIEVRHRIPVSRRAGDPSRHAGRKLSVSAYPALTGPVQLAVRNFRIDREGRAEVMFERRADRPRSRRRPDRRAGSVEAGEIGVADRRRKPTPVGAGSSSSRRRIQFTPQPFHNTGIDNGVLGIGALDLDIVAGAERRQIELPRRRRRPNPKYPGSRSRRPERRWSRSRRRAPDERRPTPAPNPSSDRSEDWRQCPARSRPLERRVLTEVRCQAPFTPVLFWMAIVGREAAAERRGVSQHVGLVKPCMSGSEKVGPTFAAAEEREERNAPYQPVMPAH